MYGALQGQQPLSGTPANYVRAQQSQRTQPLSLNGLFDAVNSTRINQDKTIVALMQQYYTGRRYVYDNSSGKQMVFDHDDVRILM